MTSQSTIGQCVGSARDVAELGPKVLIRSSNQRSNQGKVMVTKSLKIAAGIAVGLCILIAAGVFWMRYAAQKTQQESEQQAKQAAMERRALNQEEMRKDFMRQMQNKEEKQAAARRAASAASQASR